MSVELLQAAAAALGPLCDEVVFVGGASVTLWITDPAAPSPRPTKDVDVVVEVGTRAGLEDFEQRMRRRGFREDIDSGVICRWRHGDSPPRELLVDVMPSEARLLGFTNRWFPAAVTSAVERVLGGDAVIRAVTPPYLVATKLEAFASRGNGDHLGSRDLEDITLLVDGRPELVEEVADAAADVRAYLADELGALLDEPRFLDALFGFVRPDAASQARVESTILPRLRTLVGR